MCENQQLEVPQPCLAGGVRRTAHDELFFFLAVMECHYLTSSLETDAYKEEIFHQSPQQGECWVDCCYRQQMPLLLMRQEQDLGNLISPLLHIWENFLCKPKPWTVCPLTDVFRFNHLTRKEQNHLIVRSLTGCILVDNENLMRFFANFNAETWTGLIKRSNFQHYCRECHLRRLERVTLKQMPARPNLTGRKNNSDHK